MHNFSDPDEPSAITVVDGDTLLVEEVDSGWATGTNQGTGEYGFFPAWAGWFFHLFRPCRCLFNSAKNITVVITETGEELPESFEMVSAS